MTNFGNMEDNSRLENVVIVNCVLNAPLMFISIIGNALILVAMLRNPSIRSPSLVMLGSLAVSDFLVGFIAQTLFIAKELTKNPLLSTLWDTVGYPFCGVSLLIVTVLSVDRYLALHFHLRYTTLVTNSRVGYTVLIIWLVNFLSSGFYFWNDLVYHLILAVLTGICLVISTFTYIKIYRLVRQHHLQIQAQQQAVENSNFRSNTQMLQISKKCNERFCVLHLHDHVLFPIVHFIDSSWYK